MNKIYTGAVGVEFRVNTMIDLSGATTTVLKVRKPNNHDDEWTVSVSGSVMTHTTVAGELDLAGTYVLSAYVEFGSTSKHHGEAVEFDVDKPLSV